MKELNDIVQAYNRAAAQNKKTALATVVQVEGSSYRRPGARMLVTEDGLITGAVSGGCLEGDARRKALLAIAQGKNKLVTYDTTDEDDSQFGVQLGCNGIVHILFEPIDAAKPFHPLLLLKQAAAQQTPAVLITLFSLSNHSDAQPGTVLLYSEEKKIIHPDGAQLFQKSIQAAAMLAFSQQSSFIKTHVDARTNISALIEYLKPSPCLVIAGAGNDVQPLVAMASILGWNTTVVDGRSTHATAQRFPSATAMLVAKADAVLSKIPVNAQTVFLLMTHNYNYDLALLRQLLQQPVLPYIGVLGPRKKLQRMLEELQVDRSEHEVLKKLFGPVGLDLGAETAEEIALSILAEIKMVLEGRSGQSLREKTGAVHTTQNKPQAATQYLPPVTKTGTHG